MSKLISFIITTLNEEDYIEKCLKSIENQTYKNKEIIVVDSNSSDNTVKIAKKYADKVIIKPCIIPVGRNLGAKEAKGDILVFVDADVILFKDWCEKILPHLNDEKTIAAYGDLIPVPYNSKSKLVYNFFTICNNFLEKIKKPVLTKLGTAAAIKRNVFEKIGGYPENFACSEDLEISLRLNEYGGKIKFVKDAKGFVSMRRFERCGYANLLLKWFISGSYYLLTRKSFFSHYSRDFP